MGVVLQMRDFCFDDELIRGIRGSLVIIGKYASALPQTPRRPACGGALTDAARVPRWESWAWLAGWLAGTLTPPTHTVAARTHTLDCIITPTTPPYHPSPHRHHQHPPPSPTTHDSSLPHLGHILANSFQLHSTYSPQGASSNLPVSSPPFAPLEATPPRHNSHLTSLSSLQQRVNSAVAHQSHLRIAVHSLWHDGGELLRYSRTLRALCARARAPAVDETSC